MFANNFQPTFLLAVLNYLKSVFWGLALSSMLACSKEPQPAKPSPPMPVISPFQTIEQQTFAKINAHRASKNLPALSYNDALASICRRHSQQMAQKLVPFSHDGFSARLEEAKRNNINWSASAENIAYLYASRQQAPNLVLKLWLDSEGHRNNIEGNYRLTGIGVAQSSDSAYYFTQIFLR